MKRSKKVALVLMVPAATLLMTSCGEEREQALVFNTLEECIQSGLSTDTECKTNFETAKTLHPDVAPKYKDKEQCEAEYGVGHCETATGSGSSGMFMPMMMGFMAGQMFNRPSAHPVMPSQAAPVNAAEQSSAARTTTTSSGTGFNSRLTQPLYKTQNDSQSFRTGNDTVVGNKTGFTSVKPSTVEPQPGKQVTRGGFGTQGAKRSSFGG